MSKRHLCCSVIPAERLDPVDDVSCTQAARGRLLGYSERNDSSRSKNWRGVSQPRSVVRIAFVHSFYSDATPSGENSIVELSSRMLLEAGHDVRIFARRTDELRMEPLYKVKSGLRTITGIGHSPSSELRKFAPDVVHIHNLFPNYGTKWLSEWGQRIVSTIHNFRSMCANGLLFRDGGTCLDCPTGSSASALRHACYRDSRIETFPLAVRNVRGLRHDPVLSHSARVIVLSEAARGLFLRFGGPSERMVVLPNGVPAGSRRALQQGNGRWLVVGRLSREKGIHQLLDDWPESAELDLFGDGPEADSIRARMPSGVRMLGSLPRSELLERMADYDGLIFPSVCLEMQPTAVIEAMSVGIPVVAREGNAAADLVKRFGVGRVFKDRVDLESGLWRARRDREAMGSAGRSAYLGHYSPDEWLAAVEDVYTRVTSEANQNGMV